MPTASSSTRSDRFSHRALPFGPTFGPRLLFLIPDLLVLYGGLVVGTWLQSGAWTLPHESVWGWSAPIVLGAYVAAISLSGLYTTPLHEMHLPEFLRGGAALSGAWGLSIVFTYLAAPAHLPARSVMIVHGLTAVVGILGVRAFARWTAERLRPPADASTQRPPPPPTVCLHDVVPRDRVQIDRTAMTDHLSDRTVLVTGAGGSIGSELSDQILALSPFRVVYVDVSEYNLYCLERTLRERAYSGEMKFCIADVRESDVMNRLFASTRPDVVLHTAAYKHVPLMERHPAEAFRNNTLATAHLLRLCDDYDVEQFVFVSTDKAVAPTSVLGATKRLAEWYVRTAACSSRCTIVRFGNVFGSQGSVVPLFQEQLANGGPVTVTHPDMERYFMSVDEACSLILQTLLYDDHPVYIFRMGDPVPIRWLAEQLIRRWRPDVDPAQYIEYVGRRPGEKLSEELAMTGETPYPTPHPGIVGLRGPVPYSRAEIQAYVERLESLSLQNQPEALRKALVDLDGLHSHSDPSGDGSPGLPPTH